jgi:hypothetical protein
MSLMTTLSCNTVCLVWLGASVVHTKRSGALLSVHLAFALLAHFVNFATCALPKCASRAQNPTFFASLAHFVFCVGIILVFVVELFIASYCCQQSPLQQIKGPNGYLHPLLHPLQRPDHALQRSGAACTRPY